jgi:phospholipase C
MVLPSCNRAALLFLLLAGTASVVACNGGGSPADAPLFPNALRESASTTPIAHVVIVIQENRSFDNLFATFPGADGTTVGQAAPMPSPIAYACAQAGMPVITEPTSVPLTETNLFGAGFGNSDDYIEDTDLGHIYVNFQKDRDGGKMDGFDLLQTGPNGDRLPWACTYPYQYVDPSQIAPYWQIGKQYVLADHTFQVQGSGSFTAHQDLIAAGTNITPDEALIDNPTGFPWGCDGGPDEHTAIIKRGGKVFNYAGPRPCLAYSTLRDLLDAKSISWKFYANQVHPFPSPSDGSSGIWSAFDAIKAVRYSNEWGTNVVWPDIKIFADIKNGTLPAVAWVTPDGADSDHPAENNASGQHVDNGPSWVASIVNAVGESAYWKSTAVVILWDDWGGFYDHVPPPLPRNWQGGPGFRVPMLIVSAYVKPHVDHTVYQDGSILRFIEDRWNLGSLGRNDARATSIGNAFDFTMSPRSFKKIATEHDESFFLHRRPSGAPPDTQ